MKKLIKISLIILIVIIVILGGATALLFSKVPYANLTGGLVSNLESVPSFVYDKALEESKEERVYKNIPEILQFNDGSSVVIASDFELRRKEIITLFKEEVYGEVPNYDYQTDFEIIEEDPTALNNTATRKQIKLTVTTELGSSEAMILIYTPNNVEKAPTFLALNVAGNLAIHEDEAILPSSSSDMSAEEIQELRAKNSDRWPVEDIIARGYAFATVHCDDFAPNDGETYNTRLIEVFGGDTEDEEFKTINAWSFGLMKTIDYLVSDEKVDVESIMTIGHSRFGKTSLWTAALDERVQVAFANSSGTVGSAISRENTGETVAIINTLFPHWFVDGFKEYSNNETELPLDQHMLLAAIAPRKFYLSNGSDDFWADPAGEYESLKLATEAYQLYGYEEALQEDLPSANQPIHNEHFGHHIIDKNHNIGYDNWEYYLEYTDKFIK